jgi:ATPase subunit of ABC transporter with duplicated ATPase domains
VQPHGTLAAHGVGKSHGAVTILDGVSLAVPPHARIGLVGPNGIGKSTLLRVLAGIEAPDEGDVTRTPPGLTVGYLPQEVDADAGETLLAYLGRRTGVAAAEADLDRLTLALERDPGLAAEYADTLDRFLALGGEDLEPRARTICAELGLPVERLQRPIGSLSGGEAARAALTAVLLARHDVLLLDEPTNDLDFAGLEVLERFVSATPSAIVLVSHDRAFLARSVDRVVELEEGTRRAREYAGGFDEYERERERARRRHYDAFGQYVAERDRIEEQLRRRRDWVERATSQRDKKKTRDLSGHFERKLRRLDRVDKPFEPWELRLAIRSDGRSGEVVARLDGAVVERGRFRLGPIDLVLGRRDRLALLGPNGSGKTTLLQALLGRLPLAAGTRTVGSGVVTGELEQGRQSFTTDAALLDVFTGVTELRSGDARTLLAKFGLAVDDVLRPTASLSPGERTRAVLASFAARGVNLLVLDEPTNHLDLPAIEQLEAALAGFEGTAVVVSHDRRFLERFAATRTLELQRSRTYECSAAYGL